MPVLPVSDENIRAAAAILLRGGLVAFPTETVYGLGGDAFNPAALAKIFAVKRRPRFDPLIIHIAALDALDRAADLSLLEGPGREKTALLTEKLWPGPLTLVLPKRGEVPGLATSGLPTAAIRFPDHPAAQTLIRLSSGALAAPSANPFGYLSPTLAEHVRDQLGDEVDLILDGGPARVGVESTVLDMTGPVPRLLRPGGTPRERIEALIGDIAAGPAPEGPPGFRSPGQLKSHYAPRTPLTLLSRQDMLNLPADPSGAYLFFDGPSRDQWPAGRNPGPAEKGRLRVLSETGDMTEAAASLFTLLHELDGLGASRVYAQRVPEKGLGPAINDRLFRAAAAPPV
ncbi:MAG: threonylcarbamoyl-AMP synthase [Treponema sp.]|jgi:L-threonylcarbamoyladenylate synthase|nr:threonylcarbamoyl-AMP synthase [Treponema sp.]